MVYVYVCVGTHGQHPHMQHLHPPPTGHHHASAQGDNFVAAPLGAPAVQTHLVHDANYVHSTCLHCAWDARDV